VIMSARPGRIKDDIRVPLGRPRNVEALQASDDFQNIYARLWGSLREEFHAGALVGGEQK
jgi:NitT/TauT family transport system ATP-binding protein